ncbi:TetR/AcrR family transcriptional regulator [Streptomyces chartreusis]
MEAQAKRVPNARGEGERLRQEILDTATRILEDTGREDALSLRGVAREVGISAPSVYLHFKDKTALVSTVLEAAYRTLAAAMAQAGRDAAEAGTGPWEQIRAATAAYRRFAVDKPRRYRLMFNLEYEPQRPPPPTNPSAPCSGPGPTP